MDPMDKLLAESVLETTIDQLAIVGGTMPRTSLGDKSDFPHPNISDSPLDAILLHENKTMQVRIAHTKLELYKIKVNRST